METARQVDTKTTLETGDKSVGIGTFALMTALKDPGAVSQLDPVQLARALYVDIFAQNYQKLQKYPDLHKWRLTRNRAIVNTALYRNDAVFREIATTEKKGPLNNEENILPGFKGIAQKNQYLLNKPYFHLWPYWADSEKWPVSVEYDPYEVFYGSTQFTDQSRPIKLPRTMLPPWKDVKALRDFILKSPHPLTVVGQFEKAMDITVGNMVGAANLCLIVTRMGARLSETRAYPESKVEVGKEKEMLLEWNKHVANFETYRGSLSDGPGDNYYFWTYVFTTLIYELMPGKIAEKAQAIIGQGLPEMIRRKQKLGTPTVTDHYEASTIGREIGFMLSEIIKNGSVE